jgi:hypothetical protein
MTESVRADAGGTASLVLGAADRLIGDLADAVPALRAVGDALAVLAERLGVEKVIVAVDDAQLGRQVFCSGRVQLGEEGVGLHGPQGAWTQPPVALDPVAASILIRTVGIGVVRAITRATPSRSLAEPMTETTAVADAVSTATARALRHGWGFTLVLARDNGDAAGHAGLAAGLKARLRAADQLVAGNGNEVALLLPQTAGDRVPFVLARLAAEGDVPPFSYGLACCPADGTDPATLYLTAAERLAAAVRAATPAIAQSR